MRRRIAIVEDDPAIRANYADAFAKHGYEVTAHASRAEALAALKGRLPDLVLLDIGLGDEVDGGFALCRELRAQSASLPIVFLTARDGDFDTVSGLRVGALFRRAELSREPTSLDRQVERGPLRLDLDRFTASWGGHAVDLTLTEFWLVHSLAKFPGHVKNREQLMSDAHVVVDDSTIT